MNRFIYQFLLFVAAFFCVERFCHEQTDGFSMRKIRAQLPYNADYATSTPSLKKREQLEVIFSQPFYYLKSGGESYVFVSKDGHYVLKFFKHHHMRLNSPFDYFLPNILIKQRVHKLDTLFTSCKLAWTHFKKETALIYLHLNQSDDLLIPLTLYDRIGIRHKIDLDQYTFALQKKASLAYPTLTALKEAQELDAAKKRLASWVDLIVRRCQAGLVDHDARKRNFGFIKEQAIEIDLGSFTLDETIKSAENTKKIVLAETKNLKQWIHKYHPELLDYLDEVVKETLEL